jgi:hypothetical protein
LASKRYTTRSIIRCVPGQTEWLCNDLAVPVIFPDFRACQFLFAEGNEFD